MLKLSVPFQMDRGISHHLAGPHSFARGHAARL
jgi:hypothetical protein